MFMIFDKNIYTSEFTGNFGNIEICFLYLVSLSRSFILYIRKKRFVSRTQMVQPFLTSATGIWSAQLWVRKRSREFHGKINTRHIFLTAWMALLKINFVHSLINQINAKTSVACGSFLGIKTIRSNVTSACWIELLCDTLFILINMGSSSFQTYVIRGFVT